MTLLGRGTGATLVTALSGSPALKGLARRVWATGGAGAVRVSSLREASIANQIILSNLKCGSDELKCLRNADAKEIVRQTPVTW